MRGRAHAVTRLCLTLGALVALAGCHWIFKEPIPDLETPLAQYQYATGTVEMAKPLSADTSRGPWTTDRESPYFEAPPVRYRDRDYRRFIRAFSRVVSRFPDDTEHTPKAKIRLGEFHYLLGEHGLAVSYYREILDGYPDDELFQAAALFGLGRVRMAQQQFGDAHRVFTNLIQRHGDSQIPQIIELVEKARMRLFQLRSEFSR
jgi:TolA-binding protein